ncbi:hypothetical protein ACTXT7_009467 [Hymenolepis weldensis]
MLRPQKPCVTVRSLQRQLRLEHKLTEERKRFACLQQAVLKMVCERHRLSEIVITLRNFIEQSKADIGIPTHPLEVSLNELFVRADLEASTCERWDFNSTCGRFSAYGGVVQLVQSMEW